MTDRGAKLALWLVKTEIGEVTVVKRITRRLFSPPSLISLQNLSHRIFPYSEISPKTRRELSKVNLCKSKMIRSL